MNFTKRSTAPSVPECHKVDPLSLDHVSYLVWTISAASTAMALGAGDQPHG
jgi:hypothetical protein